MFGWRERGQDVALAREAFRQPPLRQRAVRQLERHRPLEHSIASFREPDRPHAAAPQLAQQAIRADLGTRRQAARIPPRTASLNFGSVARKSRVSGLSPAARRRRNAGRYIACSGSQIRQPIGARASSGRPCSVSASSDSSRNCASVRCHAASRASRNVVVVTLQTDSASRIRPATRHVTRRATDAASSTRAFSQSRRTVRSLKPSAAAISISVSPAK